MEVIENRIIIACSPEHIWNCLTHVPLMMQWLGDELMNIEVSTSWKLGDPIYIKGFHHAQFEIKGKVLEFKPHSKLAYTHLSSISNLSDEASNYTTIEFFLSPVSEGVELTVRLSNFPTYSIYKHLQFYWKTTVSYIKMVAERIQFNTAGMQNVP
jgi:uncharacterized protein YndB with AHSA1/START domain